MKVLTKIEKLDQLYPGLADNVRKWLSQGMSAEKITERLFEQYKISISKSPVSRFRCVRWVPEQELLLEKRLEAQAASEVSREQAIRASLTSKVSGDAK